MRPDDGRVNLWPLGVIAVLVILVVASVTPVVRLNSAPPPDFVALQPTGKAARPNEAKAYWETAVQVIQVRYRRTEALPEAVPADFTVGDLNLADHSPQEQARRAVYWAKLRQEWARAENWHRTVDFSVQWIMDDVESVSRGVHDFFVDHT